MLSFSILPDIPEKWKGGVLTIGNFDGVHPGHERILVHLKEQSLRHNTHSLVLLFDPHPDLAFKKASHPFLLTSMSTRILLLERLGVDFVALLPFSESYASMTPAMFIQEILRKMLMIKHLVIGENFFFGNKRSGNVKTLKEAKISVDVVSLFSKDQILISSSRIRQCLKQKKEHSFHKACHLLGRFWETEGWVVSGDQRGRKLTIPTINISYPETLCPLDGVYAGRIEDFPEGCGTPKWRSNAIINFGMRPTFEPNAPPLIEAHCLPHAPDHISSFYGTHVRIVFLDYLRNQRIFLNHEEMMNTIDQDIKKAESVHQTFPLPPLEEDLTKGFREDKR